MFRYSGHLAVSEIPRVALGPRGQPYRVSLTSPQAFTEHPAGHTATLGQYVATMSYIRQCLRHGNTRRDDSLRYC